MSSAIHATPNRAKSSPIPTRPYGAAASAASSGGHTLPAQTQTAMSGRFGHDFSSVRVHTDSRAGDTAEALGANAFTLGQDIVFGEGRYAPGSAEGDRLLAHELTHVVQQVRWGGLGNAGPISRRGDASEQEAASLADRVTQGEEVDVQAAPGAMIARDEDYTGAFGAGAYTAGQDISFGAGAYAPGGGAGRHLMAHELSHVVQQGSAGASLGPADGPPAGGGPLPVQEQMGDQNSLMESVSGLMQSEQNTESSIINNLGI